MNDIVIAILVSLALVGSLLGFMGVLFSIIGGYYRGHRNNQAGGGDTTASAARGNGGAMDTAGADYPPSTQYSSAYPGAGDRASLTISQDTPITAYKWLVRIVGGERDGIFLSSYGGARWEHGELTATCRRVSPAVTAIEMASNRSEYEELVRSLSNHHAPDEQCTCGVYALKLLRDAYQEYRGTVRHTASPPSFASAWDEAEVQVTTLVEVQLYGRVLEGELGYRAEYARITAYMTDAGVWVDTDAGTADTEESLP